MQSTSSTTAATAQPVSLAIDGMSCGHCVAAVTEALSAVPGATVRRVAVGAATVELDPQAASAEQLVQAVRDAGYEARVADRALPQAAGSSCCAPRPS